MCGRGRAPAGGRAAHGLRAAVRSGEAAADRPHHAMDLASGTRHPAAAQGLARFGDTRVMALAEMPTFDAPIAGNLSIQAVDLEARAQRIGGFRGLPPAQRQAHAERRLDSPLPFFGFDLHADAEPLACGQFALEARPRRPLRCVHRRAGGRARPRVHAVQALAPAGALTRRAARLAAGRGRQSRRAPRLPPARVHDTHVYARHYRTRDPSAA